MTEHEFHAKAMHWTGEGPIQSLIIYTQDNQKITIRGGAHMRRLAEKSMAEGIWNEGDRDSSNGGKAG